jgi:hypothetical protein
METMTRAAVSVAGWRNEQKSPTTRAKNNSYYQSRAHMLDKDVPEFQSSHRHYIRTLV